MRRDSKPCGNSERATEIRLSTANERGRKKAREKEAVVDGGGWSRGGTRWIRTRLSVDAATTTCRRI